MTSTSTTVLANPDVHIVKHEMWDADVMDAILSRGAEMGFATKDLRFLSNYKKARHSPGKNEVVYHFAKATEKDKLGRLYVRGMEGLQSFPHDIRNPLLQKHYWEIDMENAHYWLMRQLAREWKMDATHVGEYVENRRQWLEETDDNIRVAKTAFLKVAYGSAVLEFYPQFKDMLPKNTTHLLKVEEEVKALRDMCWAKHTQFHKHAAIKAKRDPKASLFALILQNIERNCLVEMDAFLQTKGRFVDVYIHDAGGVRKEPSETAFPVALLRETEAHIKTTTGYDVRLVSKGFQHGFKMPEALKEVIDEEYAGRIFVGLMGDYIAREDDSIYFFNDQTGMWDCSDTAYLCAVVKHKPRLIFKVMTDKGERILNFGGCIKNVKAMKPYLLTAVPDTKFISRNADSSYGKLLFADGIYDFYTNTFTKGFDPKIVFNKRIDRPFPQNRNEELIKLVRETLFVNAFAEGDGQEAGDYLRKALCMGLVGDYTRKKFYFGLGESNCGKGVMTGAFANAFEGYVEEWEGNELKYNSKNGQDEARKQAWIKQLMGVRLGFSSELRMDKRPIDGNLLKKVSSGGDKIRGRDHQESSEHFVNRATLFLLANDMLPITPKDSGIQTRCRFIRYKLRFVDDPTPDTDERKADSTIKDKFARDDWKDSLFFVMVDTFNEMAETERMKGGTITEPSCVMEETREWVGDDGSEELADMIRKRYVITGSPDDSVPTKDICDYIIEERGMNVSSNKVGRMLTTLIKAKNPNCPRDRSAVGEDEVGKQRLGIRFR